MQMVVHKSLAGSWLGTLNYTNESKDYKGWPISKSREITDKSSIHGW